MTYKKKTSEKAYLRAIISDRLVFHRSWLFMFVSNEIYRRRMSMCLRQLKKIQEPLPYEENGGAFTFGDFSSSNNTEERKLLIV